MMEIPTDKMRIKAHGLAIQRLEKMMLDVITQFELINKALKYLDEK